MTAPNFFVVFEEKHPDIYSSWNEARKDDNIEGPYWRTFATWREAFAVFSVYKEREDVRILRSRLLGAPTHGPCIELGGLQWDPTEQAIQDAVTIGSYVVTNLMVSNDEDDDDKVN